MSGGRVSGITSMGKSIDEAMNKSYEKVKEICGEIINSIIELIWQKRIRSLIKDLSQMYHLLSELVDSF